MKKLLFLPVFLLAFCGGAFAQDDASSAADIKGKWSGQFTDPEGKPVPFTMTITDSTYEFDFTGDGKADQSGEYTAQDMQVTVWDTVGENICPSDKKGVYSYSLDGDMLTFTKVSDDCPGRGAEPLVLKRE